MTVIAWDGKTICADKQATCGNTKSTTTKLRRIATGEVLAWTGDQDSGEMLAKWYADGADPKWWPDFQKDKDDWCRLVVADANGVRYFERRPIATAVEDRFRAFGSGADLALAAMHCGRTAREAVEVACIYDAGCGQGVDEEILR